MHHARHTIPLHYATDLFCQCASFYSSYCVDSTRVSNRVSFNNAK